VCAEGGVRKLHNKPNGTKRGFSLVRVVDDVRLRITLLSNTLKGGVMFVASASPRDCL
jgi:hypothetical protein